ncbi:MAG: glycosyltransferase, partial [Chloroflexota bacterium]|nr:glycosyltransferase [Chloroflexota bacterium]
MGTHEPVVSVIIPTYNRAAYLREAVASVRAQTYATWELIVVDDGSTDDTWAYLSSLREHRLRVIAQAHCGNPASLRNVGLRAARGEYIAFLDSDDLWAPEKLETQLRDLVAHPDHRWSYSKVRFIDGKSQEIPESRFAPWRPYSGMIFEELLIHEAKIACPTVLTERSLIEEASGFDESLPF